MKLRPGWQRRRASFVQQEWFLAGVHGLHGGHSDEITIRDGGGPGPQGRQHLSAVVVGGVGKHVLESVGLSQQQPDLLVAPVDGRQVLQQHEEALQGKDGLMSAVCGRATLALRPSLLLLNTMQPWALFSAV